MSEFALESPTLDVPEEVLANRLVLINGSGFLANTIVTLRVQGRDATFGAQLRTDSRGSFTSIGEAMPASGVLATTGEPLTEDDTVTIDETVYTFKAAITVDSDENDVLLGDYAVESLGHLRSAINLEDYVNEVYGAATLQHPSVEATSITAAGLGLVARNGGPEGNDIETTTTAAELSFAEDTLTGGSVANNQDYLNFVFPYSGEWIITATDGINSVEARIRVWSHT